MNNQFLTYSTTYIDFITIFLFFMPHKNKFILTNKLKTKYPCDLKLIYFFTIIFPFIKKQNILPKKTECSILRRFLKVQVLIGDHSCSHFPFYNLPEYNSNLRDLGSGT